MIIVVEKRTTNVFVLSVNVVSLVSVARLNFLFCSGVENCLFLSGYDLVYKTSDFFCPCLVVCSKAAPQVFSAASILRSRKICTIHISQTSKYRLQVRSIRIFILK